MCTRFRFNYFVSDIQLVVEKIVVMSAPGDFFVCLYHSLFSLFKGLNTYRHDREVERGGCCGQHLGPPLGQREADVVVAMKEN
jgi:hypothetical protein